MPNNQGIKDDDRCQGIKKNGDRCQYKGKHDGYCGIHCPKTPPKDVNLCRNAILIQKKWRRYEVRKYMEKLMIDKKDNDNLHNDTSLFTLQPSSEIRIPIIYEINLDTKRLRVKESFPELYEWFCRRKGETTDFRCPHTRCILSEDDKNKLIDSFRGYNKFIGFNKNIKTLFESLFEICIELDNSTNIFFTQIFALKFNINLLQKYVSEIEHHLIPEFGINPLSLDNGIINKYIQINTIVYNINKMVSNGSIKLVASPELPLDNNKMPLNNDGQPLLKNGYMYGKLISAIKLIEYKKYIIEKLKDFCMINGEINWSRLSIITDSVILDYIVSKHVNANNSINTLLTLEDNPYQKLVK